MSKGSDSSLSSSAAVKLRRRFKKDNDSDKGLLPTGKSDAHDYNARRASRGAAGDDRIDSIVSILKKEVKKFKTTTLNDISLRNDPYKVLISCLLSLRTKDETTAAASTRLFKVAPDVNKLAALPVKTIEKLIYPVGFYKTKAKRIKDISKVLIDKYNSKVPDTIDELLKLYGVGRKTANIVVTLGFKKPGVAVDTHVHRISNRLGYVRTKNPEETEWALRKKLPEKYWLVYNDLLVAWGQNVCKPISPLCSKCAIKDYCYKVGVNISR